MPSTAGPPSAAHFSRDRHFLNIHHFFGGPCLITITRPASPAGEKRLAAIYLARRKFALPAVQVTAGAEGLRLAAGGRLSGALSTASPYPHPECQLRAPLDLFRELAAN